MSPEQWLGAPDLRTASDVYALGVVLYETLTGRRPFESPSAVDLRQKHLRELPAPPNSIVPDIDSRLNAIVLKCLAKAEELRFKDFAELGAELEAVCRAKNLPYSVPTPAVLAETEARMTAIDWDARQRAFNALGKKEQALECAKRALQCEPHLSHLNLRVAQNLISLGRSQEA